MKKYILDKQGIPVPEPDLIKWSEWFEHSRKQRIVKQEIIGQSKVSTVFLSLDHGWILGKPPILWETMVFGGNLDLEQDRCSGTRKDALSMHKRMVKRVKKGQK